MGWLYHTNIFDEDDNSYNEAFNIFINQCFIHEDKIKKELSNNNYFRFIIRTDGENDKIFTKDGKIFLKSKFLIRKSFKKQLIDYYRPLGVYVDGPNEFKRRDGTEIFRWWIELSSKRQ